MFAAASLLSLEAPAAPGSQCIMRMCTPVTSDAAVSLWQVSFLRPVRPQVVAGLHYRSHAVEARK